MEFKKRVLKINLYGESVEMTFPTVKQFKEFDKNKEKENKFEMMCDFVVSLGFPDSKIDELEPAHLTQIINKLVGVEEKK